MSYQPVPAQPMPVAPAKAPGRALTWIGILLMVAGIGAAVALYLGTQSRFDSRVESLASDSGALSGCVTDLTFSKTGTFVLYYLSEGAVRVNGSNEGCVEDGEDDDVIVDIDADTDVPDMTVTLTDDEDEEVRLSRTTLDQDSSLEAGGVVAWPYRQVTIRSAGDYRLEIRPEDDDVDRFALGVGPKIEEPSLFLPALIAAAGIVLGIVLIVVNGARRSAARRRPTGTAVGYGYPGGQFQAPGQYPAQPPVVYQPPAPQGFDHPTQAMPPIAHSPEPVGPFAPPAGPPAGTSAAGTSGAGQPGAPAADNPWARPPAEPSGWTAPASPAGSTDEDDTPR